MLIANQDLQVADHTSFFPNTSFGENGVTLDFIREQGYYQVTVWLDHDPKTQKLSPTTPYLIGDMCYTVIVENKTTDELQADLFNQAARARIERNYLLAQSDWTQISDSTANKTEWATYRQALRDLTNQEGFPISITWPRNPNQGEEMTGTTGI